MSTMKRSWLLAILFAINVYFVACNDTGAGDDNDSDTTATTRNDAEDKNNSALSSKAAEKDAQFVVDVVASNYGEVKLAKLAQQKSSHKELKEVAQTLEVDHSEVLDQLRSLASTKSITIPTEESGEAKDKLKELTDEKASEFDKEWCETLMDSHKTSISKFENAANDISDPDIKNFVNTVLPKLRIHHDKLMECHKKLK
jgi:predicted outer membrane protein